MADCSMTIAPAGRLWGDQEPYVGETGHTRQGFWYRLRAQREYGWPNEGGCYWLKLTWFDQIGRMWQHNTLAVVDDFGSLVEVLHG